MTAGKKVIKVYDEGSLYVGLDECNHGKYPEFFIAAMSHRPGDGFPVTPNKLAKIRRPRIPPFASLGGREYTFLEANDGHYASVKQHEFLGTVITSLIWKSVGEELEELLLFIDGEKTNREINYARGMIVERTHLEEKRIHISAGAKYDEMFGIVNFADALANSLWRIRGKENQNREKHRRDFLTIS